MAIKPGRDDDRPAFDTELRQMERRDHVFSKKEPDDEHEYRFFEDGEVPERVLVDVDRPHINEPDDQPSETDRGESDGDAAPDYVEYDESPTGRAANGGEGGHTHDDSDDNSDDDSGVATGDGAVASTDDEPDASVGDGGGVVDDSESDSTDDTSDDPADDSSDAPATGTDRDDDSDGATKGDDESDESNASATSFGSGSEPGADDGATNAGSTGGFGTGADEGAAPAPAIASTDGDLAFDDVKEPDAKSDVFDEIEEPAFVDEKGDFDIDLDEKELDLDEVEDIELID